MFIKNEDLLKILIDKGLLKEDVAKGLLEMSERKSLPIDDLIEEKGIIPEEELGKIISDLYEKPYIKLGDQTIKEELLTVIPYQMANHQLVIPFEQYDGMLKVAFNNPNNVELISFIENKTGLKVEPYYANKKDIKLALKVYNRDVNEKFNKLLKGAMSDIKKIESLEDASKIVDTIILFAYQNEASDIHIEPHKQSLVVRNRIDGLLSIIAELPLEIMDLVVTRIKVLGKMRTDEHRAAQDGRFKIELEGNEITLRVSILPTYDGEKVVMRLLTSDNKTIKLESLGYSKHNMEVINRNMQKSHGMILMTGPTGSGKTTTLYALLRMLNSTDVNISTIEDPIEYRLEGVNQTQVNPKTDLTFANGLRALVRQDPDIIMVGEIRDQETASVAINAALTGHLVLATLHTNDAVSTLPRLMEMGVQSFLVSATTNMIVAQRLVRTICKHCKKPYEMSIKKLTDLGATFQPRDLKRMMERFEKQGAEILTFYMGEGCEHCNHTGFKGRGCIAEVFEISDEVKKHISNNTSLEELKEIAGKQGMVNMFMDGVEKVIEGETTLEEVLRVMCD
ncbi:MAG: GspE/PulE family protein [Candidatus Gracilibacteria bacterium]|jgi:type IV pilus assembly protein PilB